jgi:hypothetical protein
LKESAEDAIKDLEIGNPAEPKYMLFLKDLIAEVFEMKYEGPW